MRPAALLLGLLAGLPCVAAAAEVGGALEYSLRHRDGENDRAFNQQAATAELRGNAAIWREWLARIDGALRLSEVQAENGDRDTNNQLVTGNGALALVPRSHFPFRAFVDRTDSRVDSSIGGDTDRQTTTYGFDQRYFDDGGGRYGLSYTRRDLEQTGIGGLAGDTPVDSESTDEALDLTAQRRFGLHELDYSFNHDRTEELEVASSNDTQTHVLSHQYDPSEVDLSWSNRLSHGLTERDVSGPLDERDERRQFSSTANWRPETVRPSRVTANALWRERVDRLGGETFDNELSSVRARGSYDWTDALRLGASASLSDELDDGQRELRSEQEADLSYRPDSIELGTVLYDWSGAGSFGNRDTSEAPSVQSASATLSHGLSRRRRLDGGASFTWRLNQRGRAIEDTADRHERNLSHSATATWNLARGRQRAFVQGRLTDNRQFGDSEDVFQLANLQASSNVRLDETSQLSADITLQATRNIDRDSSPTTEDTDYATSADLAYDDSRFLGVHRLVFRSELSYRSDSFLELAEEREPGEDEATELSWINRLDYRIGRLDLRAESEVVRREEELDYQVFFSVRREFGN